MPELPDLVVIAERLNKKMKGLSIERATILRPIVVRDPGASFESSLKARTILSVDRRGKHILVSTDGELNLVFHMRFWGRFGLYQSSEKLLGSTVLRLPFSNGTELRYMGMKLMSRVYMVRGRDFSSIPGFRTPGPDADDLRLTEEDFLSRLKRQKGMLKSVLTNQGFVAGIGSAYADEILFDARILPVRKKSLSQQEAERLSRSTRKVIRDAVKEIGRRIGDNIHEEIRDSLKVHGKGGEPCERCGNPISELRPKRQLTNFCRGCQK